MTLINKCVHLRLGAILRKKLTNKVKIILQDFLFNDIILKRFSVDYTFFHIPPSEMYGKKIIGKTIFCFSASIDTFN